MSYAIPIIGQEAVCPDGLGRVVAFERGEHEWVQVETYVNNRGCKWDPHNVQLLPLPYPLTPVDFTGVSKRI